MKNESRQTKNKKLTKNKEKYNLRDYLISLTRPADIY